MSGNIIEAIEAIVESDSVRLEDVKRLQEAIWSHYEGSNRKSVFESNCLELADSLDNYTPHNDLLGDSIYFFGKDRLVEILRDFLRENK